METKEKQSVTLSGSVVHSLPLQALTIEQETLQSLLVACLPSANSREYLEKANLLANAVKSAFSVLDKESPLQRKDNGHQAPFTRAEMKQCIEEAVRDLVAVGSSLMRVNKCHRVG